MDKYIHEIFKNKVMNKDKLLSFGFFEDNNVFHLQTPLIYDFILSIDITPENIKTTLYDKDTKDEYTLHLNDNFMVSYVGEIRTAYHEMLSKICDSCFDKVVFKSDNAQKVIKYIKQKYNDELEFLWEKFDDNAICRRKDNKKWYIAFMKVKKCKLESLQGESMVEIIDVRVDRDVSFYIDNKHIFAGYHMNKKNWITILLESDIDIDEVYKLIDISYTLAK